jgi:HlyD family secretion protein
MSDEIDSFLGQTGKQGWSKRKKWLVGGGVAVLCIVSLGMCMRGGGNAQKYVTGEVTRGDMVVFVNATGNLAPTNQVSVGSELSGLMEHVYVDVNARVTRGQRLAQIDTTKLMDQIRRSQASLQQAYASVMLAQASLGQSRAQLARLEEVARLSGGKVPSVADLDVARAQAARDVANLASARASVQAAQAQVATDRTNLGKASIISPVNGVILVRQIEPGQTVAASFNTPTLFVIAEDLTSMKLEVKVDEADVGLVREGQSAKFSVDAYPGKSFAAKIIRVNVGSNNSVSSASSTASASSSAVVSYGAVLAVSNPDFALRPGMTATANIETSKQANVVMVPNAALRFVPKKTGEMTVRVGMGPPPSSVKQEVGFTVGSTKSLYVVGSDGALSELRVQVGSSNGVQTIVSGADIKIGMKLATGEMAPAK